LQTSSTDAEDAEVAEEDAIEVWESTAEALMLSGGRSEEEEEEEEGKEEREDRVELCVSCRASSIA